MNQLVISTLLALSCIAVRSDGGRPCRCSVPTGYFSSCKAIQTNNTNAPSGEYTIRTSHGTLLDTVYCEMGLNGGGYTFIHPFDLPKLTNAELQAMFTDKTSFLMRLRKNDNTQPYAVLQQLALYGSIPLRLGLTSNSGYATPVNAALGTYLYYGFIPIVNASNTNTQGLKVNGLDTTFTNCDSNPNSYVALFPNFRELTPSTYGATWTFSFGDQLFARHLPNPSGRVIPEDFFIFLETHWGGCGTYTQTDGRTSSAGILGAAIGFR